MIPIPDPSRLLGGLWRREAPRSPESLAGGILGLALWAAAIVAAIVVGTGAGFWLGLLAFVVATMVVGGLTAAVPILGAVVLAGIWSWFYLLVTDGLVSPMPWQPVHVLGVLAVAIVFILAGWSEQRGR